MQRTSERHFCNIDREQRDRPRWHHHDNMRTTCRRFQEVTSAAWNFASVATLHVGHVPVPDEVGLFIT
jgi:hypothetical protein